jgi:hypothetical protein
LHLIILVFLCICSYGIVFNSSFNNDIHRSQVNSAVGDIIRSFSVNHKVDLDNPDIFILVDTYKSAISVGISRNYKKYSTSACWHAYDLFTDRVQVCQVQPVKYGASGCRAKIRFHL